MNPYEAIIARMREFEDTNNGTNISKLVQFMQSIGIKEAPSVLAYAGELRQTAVLKNDERNYPFSFQANDPLADATNPRHILIAFNSAFIIFGWYLTLALRDTANANREISHTFPNPDATLGFGTQATDLEVVYQTGKLSSKYQQTIYNQDKSVLPCRWVPQSQAVSAVNTDGIATDEFDVNKVVQGMDRYPMLWGSKSQEVKLEIAKNSNLTNADPTKENRVEITLIGLHLKDVSVPN